MRFFLFPPSTEHVSSSVIYCSSTTQFSSQDAFPRTRNKGHSVSMVSHMYTGDLSGILHRRDLQIQTRNSGAMDKVTSAFHDWIWDILQITLSHLLSCHSLQRSGEVVHQRSQKKAENALWCWVESNTRTHARKPMKEPWQTCPDFSRLLMHHTRKGIFFLLWSSGKLLRRHSHDTVTERKVSIRAEGSL